MRAPKKDFTIGADPEFAIRNRGKNIYSEDYFYDSNGDLDEIGCDGGGQLFELRPAPSKEPLDIVVNLHKILETEYNNTKRCFYKSNWIAQPYLGRFGGMGGHIHFGVGSKYPLIKSNLMSKLDAYLGSISILIEDPAQSNRRRRYGYGHAFDYRLQSHGFEYRTPSTWLHSPQIAAGMLCLAKTIGISVLNNEKLEFYADKDDVINWINISDKQSFKNLFPQIWSNIQNLSLYEKYFSYINVLHDLITNNLTSSNHGKTMRENWGFPLQLTSDKQKLKKESLELIWES